MEHQRILSRYTVYSVYYREYTHYVQWLLDMDYEINKVSAFIHLGEYIKFLSYHYRPSTICSKKSRIVKFLGLFDD